MEKQYVSFEIGDKKYCVDIMQVQEVVREKKVTAMPDVPTYVEGIINLRGVVTPVISVRKKLGIDQVAEEAKKTETPEDTAGETVRNRLNRNTQFMKLIIVRISGVQVGFLVDSLDKVFSIDEDAIQSAEGVARNLDQALIDGVARVDEDVYIILNAKNILDIEEEQFIKDEIIE